VAFTVALLQGRLALVLDQGDRMARFIRAATAALGFVLLSISAQLPGAEPEAAYPTPPQQLFTDLFVAVQSQAIYPDSKAFPDAVPESTPDDILAQYHALRPDSPAALRRFTDAHFLLPRDAAAPASPPAQVPITRHIDGLWDTLTRSTASAPPFASLLALPYAYVVPGGRFREIYYWDSYFTMLGLEQSGRHDLVEDMVRDFAYLIDHYGHIPNGTRSYYLSRSQPPFFYAMVGLLSADDPAGAYAQYLPQLEREYAFWMDGAGSARRGHAHRRVVAMADGAILNRYWDDRATPRDESFREDSELARTSVRPADDLYRDIRAAAESGWDFSSRWFADARMRATIETTEIVPVDLNSLMFGLENAIHDGCQRRADQLCARRFARLAAARRAAIDRYLWDRASGAYLDYRWSTGVRLARLSAATLYPLFVAAASGIQARAVAKTATAQLLKPGGIVTSTLETGQQWDAPNGWAPLQWIAIAGLRHYQQTALARTIACRWISVVNDVYRNSGKLVEKYDVVTIGRSGGGGEYPLQDGFGWTNGVMRKLMALYPIDEDSTDASQCPAA
jgi:alpha,alpha-trehalase